MATIRILCIEDNPQNMRLVRKLLKHEGYEVLEAEDGLSGVHMAEHEKPDLILMDINLPDIDGLEATRRIKAQADLHPIPIVALTANAMYGDEERCLAAGCNGYVSKPVNKAKLLDVVTEFLQTDRETDNG
jgi:two-component system cell cycle response regulator DivK